MLRKLNSLSGYTILAIDGAVGKVHNFFFDDIKWTIRYFVVETGLWLPGRKVLLAPSSLEAAHWDAEQFAFDLTQDEIKGSPDINLEKPVSLQQQIQLHSYYEWPYYWLADGFFIPLSPPHSPIANGKRPVLYGEQPGDCHLRSSKKVKGYHIRAVDGEIGHVEDFLVNGDGWIIRYMIVNTRNWLPGKKVLVSPDWITDIRWADSKVSVDLTKKAVKNSPKFDPDIPMTRTYENFLYTYYSHPKYWEE